MPMTSGGGSFPNVDKGEGREVNAVPGLSTLGGRRLADETTCVVIGGNDGSEKLVIEMAPSSSSEILASIFTLPNHTSHIESSPFESSTGIHSTFPWPSSVLYAPTSDGVLRAHADTSGMERPIPIVVLSDTSQSLTLEIDGRGRGGGPGMGPGMGDLGGNDMTSGPLGLGGGRGKDGGPGMGPGMGGFGGMGGSRGRLRSNTSGKT